MTTTTIADSVYTAPSLNQYEKGFSITIAEIQSLEDENKRSFHGTGAAYVLPNDNVEHERLELQHRLLWRMMGNKVFHAPLSSATIQKTLDIGCGTGAVTHEMASIFPNAQVFGADLSPVPQVRQRLLNINYVQGNIMDINDVRFEQGSFDLVFSRLLVLGMSNWKTYIEHCVALTKPGGWIEMHDYDHKIRRVPEHVSSFEHLRPHAISISEITHSSHPTDDYHDISTWLWDTTFETLLALSDVDIRCGSKIASLFVEAGLTDIKIRRYMVPYSRWEGLTTEEKEIADYLETFVRDLVPVAIRKAGENAGSEYSLEVEAAIDDARKYYEGYQGGRSFLWMYVVCGRKPEQL